MIKFFAQGDPRPQGSMRAFNNRIVHNKSPELMAWRKVVGEAAKTVGCIPIDGPIIIFMRFILKRPKTVKRKHPTVPPDTDKLVRSVLDALTKIAYIDDSQVIELTATKEYGDVPGVEIVITDEFDALDCS